MTRRGAWWVPVVTGFLAVVVVAWAECADSAQARREAVATAEVAARAAQEWREVAQACLWARAAEAHPVRVVEATWYGDAYDGRVCAAGVHERTGERFYADGYTFAGNGYPFGAVVVFRYGGREVAARCNDRMADGTPDDRVDLSEICARRLGLLQIGRARIEATEVWRPLRIARVTPNAGHQRTRA